MEGLKPPKPMCMDSTNLSETWRKWKQQFTWYATASGLADMDEKLQCATLLHCIGEEAAEVYNTFTIAATDVDKFVPLINKFEEHFTPQKNLTYERHRFNSRIQLDGESFDAFVTDLKTRAKTCEFGLLTDSLIKDRIVYGIKDDTLRERLLRVSNLGLKKAIETCKAAEQSKTQVAALAGKPPQQPQVGVDAIRAKHVERSSKDTGHVRPWHQPDRRPIGQFQQGACTNCGESHPPRQCRAYGKTCRACGLRNHFARFCRKTQAEPRQRYQGRRPVNMVEANEPDFDVTTDQLEELFVGTIDSTHVQYNEVDWHITMPVNKRKITFKIDTGSQANIIPLKLFRNIRDAPRLSHANVRLTAYDGSTIPVKGKCNMTLTHHGCTYTTEFFVANVTSEPVLGAKASIDMGLIKRIYNVNTTHDTEKISQTHDPRSILGEYPDLCQGIGCLKGVTHHISLRDDATPVVHPPRRVPESLKPKLKETLHKMEVDDIIARVDEPTDWVNSIVLVEKSDNSLRVCLDPKELNQSIKREHYALPTIEDITAKLAGAKFFSVLDASNSFWQIKLDDASSKLVTFNTCFGRYRFKRMPFGISSASEVFQKVLAQILDGLEGVTNSIDDILVYADTKEEHDSRLRKVLDRLREYGVRLKRSKCRICVPEVKYVGVIFSGNGIRTDPDKVKAVTDMPPPHDKSSLMRFLGMVTYFGKFIPCMSTITAPLRGLLSKDTLWSWDKIHDTAVEKLKSLLTEAPVLGYYDPSKPIVVTADASKDGIGAAILQGDHPIAYASRSLTSAEQNYAQIEKETLAVTYACERFNQYLYGRHFTVQSDHKPLETIVNKPLHKAPPRIQRFLLRLQKYNFTLIHVPGKNMQIADTLSRANLPGQSSKDMEHEVELQVHSLVENLPVSKQKREQFQVNTASDPILQKLMTAVNSGWPKYRVDLDSDLKTFWDDREEYHIAHGIVLKGKRIVVPKSMQAEMLDLIHEGHLGTDRCQRRAKETLFWPGMNAHIADKVARCATCQKHANKLRKEPLMSHPLPTRPWQHCSSDLFFFHCKDYLLVVDAFSGYFEIEMLENTASETVIKHIKNIFARHGIPETLLTDNGPQYSSHKFKDFAEKWDFIHNTSSPRYPQSNGLAERTVQTVKNLLKKARENGKDPYLALLTYRDTPRGNEHSPAQVLFGRRLRTTLPTTANALQPKEIDSNNVLMKLQERRLNEKQCYDSHANKTEHKPLDIGSRVRILQETEWVPGSVISKTDNPRSFNVSTPNGNILRRNRSQIMDIPQNSEMEIPATNYALESDDSDISVGQSNAPHSANNIMNTGVTTRSGRISRPNPRYHNSEFVRY